MISYLKGCASAISIAMIGITVMSKGFYNFYIFLMYISGFAYVFGLLGIACLFLIKKKNCKGVKSYFLFLILGIVCGGFMELLTEGDLFPYMIILTTLGSLAFLASQEIKNKAAVYTLSALPILIIGFCTVDMNV